GLELVGCQHHDHIGPGAGVGDALDLESAGFDLLRGRGARAQCHDDIDAAVLEVQRVGMALRAVADDGDLLRLDDRKVGVFVVIDVDGHVFAPGTLETSIGAGPRAKNQTGTSRAAWPRCMAATPERTSSSTRPSFPTSATKASIS